MRTMHHHTCLETPDYAQAVSQQASEKQRMIQSSLKLPVPILLDNNMYPHSGRLQDDSYRRPWCGSLGSPYKLEYTDSVSDYLKSELCPTECVERFTVCISEVGGDVVPSSNPASPGHVESQEALCLLNGGDEAPEQDEWTEVFTEVDVRSVYFTEQDLFLPDEVLMSENQLKSYLPSLTTLLKRLKPYPVSDLLDLHQTGALLSEHIGEFSPYSSVPYNALDSCSAPEWITEEFGNETILHVEDLMLPDFIEINAPCNQELISCRLLKLREALNVTPEADEEHGSVLDTLWRGMVTSSEWETFTAPVTDSVSDSTSERTISPLPFRSYVDLEIDLILAPPSPPSDWKAKTELFPPTDQLSPETVSSGETVHLLSDGGREDLERDVWLAEKHPQCVSRLLLTERVTGAEPPAPPMSHRSLPELLSSLQAELEHDDTDVSCFPSLLPVMSPDPILTQAMTVERHTAVKTDRPEVDMTEQFTPLSLTQIDELLRDSESAAPSNSPIDQDRATETSVTACIRRSKTVRFLQPELEVQKHRTDHKVKTTPSPAVSHPSTRNTQNNRSDSPGNTAAKRSILLKSRPKLYTHSGTDTKNHSSASEKQENSLSSGAQLGVPRSTSSHTVAHTLLTKDHQKEPMNRDNKLNNMDTSSENDFSLTYTSSGAHNYSGTNTEQKFSTATNTTVTPSQLSSENVTVDGALSRCCAQREPRSENRNTTNHPTNLLLATNLTVLKSPSSPLRHRGTASHRSTLNSGATTTPPQQRDEKTPCSGSRSHALEFLDPVSAFMVLRGVLKLPEEPGPAATPVCPTVVKLPPESPLKQATESSRVVPERSDCKTVHVPPTDTERGAYWELHALARPVLLRLLDSGALRNTDFTRLTAEHTRFCVKEQETLRSTGQGREYEYNSVALLHILVTARDLLLRCDLDTATGHLEKARSTCTLNSLQDLLRKFQVLRYLRRKWAEPQLRVRYLQEQISAWLQRTSFHRILIVVAVENVREVLVKVLSQIPGNSVAAPILDQDSRVDMKPLRDSRCVVVCVQQLQCGFPWWSFSAVFEFQCLGDSVWRNCARNRIHYTCFTTETPSTDPDWSSASCAPLGRVPFVLLITEGLVKHRDLLRLLESTYNMTLLERTHCPSLQRLGSTDLYDVISVDENAAVLLQHLGELEQERAAERVVLRLSALSVQFSHCWVLLLCSDHCSARVCGEVFRNLALIHSAVMLFGQKSEGLDVKVLLAYDVADIARCVHQVCLHTLLNSQTDVCNWLDREWFSVLPTVEEKRLLYFPCVNSVVAQLLLSRAPSLQWLLEASHTQLEKMFPEITPSVFKIFTDMTAALRLHIAATQCENEVAHIHSWGLDNDDPLPHTHSNPFLIHSSMTPQSPGFIQEPGTVSHGWFGAEDQTRGSGGGEAGEQRVLEASSLISGLSFTRTHTAPCTPSTQSLHPHSTPQLLPHLSERKRPAGGAIHTVFPQWKRGRLLFERVPGRSDGQTRLRFF